jgi:hypothetical protein
MKKNYFIKSGPVVPQSFITKDRQRLKQHIDTVYLNDGDEFEIEIFNPKEFKVLAKIELNGISIGNGIVLRPGERVFLERFLDDAKKFKFETYTVYGNNKVIIDAIKNNGDVTIRFYNEFVQTILNTLTNGTGVSNTWTINNPSIYASNTSTFCNVPSFTTNTVSFTNTFTNTSLNFKELETGRVEKGSISNQKFSSDNTTFEITPTATNWWKLKPKSTKPIDSTDLVIYCSECGSKRKKPTFKFCPHCGTKY